MTTFNYQNNYQQNNYQQYNSKNPLQLFYNPLYNPQQFNNLYNYINQQNILSLLKSKQISFNFFSLIIIILQYIYIIIIFIIIYLI